MLDHLEGKVLDGKYQICSRLFETETTALLTGQDLALECETLIKVFKPGHIWPSGHPYRRQHLDEKRIWDSDGDAPWTFQEERLHYVAICRPEGKLLREELENGHLSTECLDRVLKQASQIVQAARSRGFEHEGLDSTKIWITDQGDARLFDFDFIPQAKPRVHRPLYPVLSLAGLAVVLALLFALQQWGLWPFDQLAHSPLPTPAPTRAPTTTFTPTPSPTANAALLAEEQRTPPWTRPTQTPTATLTPTPIRTLLAWGGRKPLTIFAAPGAPYELSAKLEPGVQVDLNGCTWDRQWWRVEYIGQAGWVRAGSAVSNLHDPCAQARMVFPTRKPTFTPSPEATKLPTPMLTPIPSLVNPTFDGVKPNKIPGWHHWATDNCPTGTTCKPEMYDKPLYKEADDPVREINGSTLQIDATGFVHFRAGLYQIVSVPPGSTVQATIQARAFSSHGSIRVHIGLDANGLPNCDNARWGPHADLNQGIRDPITLSTAKDPVGSAGLITVCLFAETSHAAHSNAAFFDDATLKVYPP